MKVICYGLETTNVTGSMSVCLRRNTKHYLILYINIQLVESEGLIIRFLPDCIECDKLPSKSVSIGQFQRIRILT